LVLDKDAITGAVRAWSSIGLLTQRWGFEPAASGHFRLRNIGTGRYLTWDHKGVVGRGKRGPESFLSTKIKSGARLLNTT